MSVYRHFGLRAPSFEALPNPRLFYAAPSHQEALATLQYTVHADRGCCVVLGESGSGKTLLARMLCQAVGQQTTILWTHSIEQSGKSPLVKIYAPGSFREARVEPAVGKTTLSVWARSRSGHAPSALLIVDDADELPRAAWRSVVSLLVSEADGARSPNIALFGLPSLRQVLGTPGLARLRRRAFRTYVLQPLTCEQVRAYINCRVSASGGEANEIFSDEAITQLHHLARGNPGLINLVCDNAMIDAYGEGRQRIEAEHVLTAVHTIVGGRPFGRDPADALPRDGATAPALPPPLPSDHRHAAGRDDGDGRKVIAEANLSESSLPPILARATRRISGTEGDIIIGGVRSGE